jgi:hypothetical protein
MAGNTTSDRMSEAEVKLALGDWLSDHGFAVFDEKPNRKRPDWGFFQVSNVDRGKRPDLLVRGDLAGAKALYPGAYVAIEIKPGYKHHDVLDGFDAVLDYFGDYLWGAQYLIDEKPIEIAAFTFATLFSREGYLFAEEAKFNPRGIVRGPWDAYPMTFTISRLLWRQKDNMVKRFQSLGAIPKIERKIKAGIAFARQIPEIGVLVLNPRLQGSVLLMISKNPYHWHFRPEGQRIQGA